MRAERSQLSPAQKMDKMRRWFEQNEGIPPRGGARLGFDMGQFWKHCCSGTCNKERFAAALANVPKMKAAYEAGLEGKAARAELPPARKMEKMRLWFDQNEGIPRRGDTRPDFDMSAFWNGCCSGKYHKELFAATLSKSPKMRAAREARLEDKAARAKQLSPVQKMEKMQQLDVKLSPAQKMAKVRRWFQQNEGIPPRGDTRAGFDMGVFWKNCCSGHHKELFETAHSKSPKMKAAHGAYLVRKTARAAHKRRRRTSQTSIDEGDCEGDEVYDEEMWIDGVPVWSRCAP